MNRALFDVKLIISKVNKRTQESPGSLLAAPSICSNGGTRDEKGLWEL